MSIPSRWRPLFIVQTVLLLGTVYVPLVILINSISHNGQTAGTTPNDATLSYVLGSIAILLVGCLISIGIVISSSIFLRRYSCTAVAKSALQWARGLLVASIIGIVVPVGYTVWKVIG